MSAARAEKQATSSTFNLKPTAYEISKAIIDTVPTTGAAKLNGSHTWQPVGIIETRAGADSAIRKWCEEQGDKFTGGTLRAVPTSRITERDVKIETKRQLTLGAP